jgi:hypothetical protein
MLFKHLAVVGITLGLLGCAGMDEDWGDGPVSFRCLPAAGIGMVGLDSVDIAGTPTVSGPFASVFSNELVSLAGDYDLEGNAISGGSVTIDGANEPGGNVIENATKVSVADPTAEVRAAKTNNDNDTIGCVIEGDDCISVVSDYVLSLASERELTLSAGVYYFEGISVSGQAKLHTDGDVVIYLDGPATFNGGSATNPDEDSLTIISSGTGEIRLNGAAQSTMHIFAPFATVRLAGTQGFKGTVLASHLRVNGTADIEVTGSVADVFGLECTPSSDSLPTPPPV